MTDHTAHAPIFSADEVSKLSAELDQLDRLLTLAEDRLSVGDPAVGELKNIATRLSYAERSVAAQTTAIEAIAGELEAGDTPVLLL